MTIRVTVTWATNAYRPASGLVLVVFEGCSTACPFEIFSVAAHSCAS